jgi:twitching motility protein PilT
LKGLATPAHIESFADEVGVFPPGDVQKLLSMIVDPTSAVDAPRHASRCKAFAAIVTRSANPELFVPLVRALRAADATVRATVAQLIPRVNNIGKHAELCQMLGSSEPAVRKAAADALRPIIGPSAMTALVTIVEDPNFRGRIEAIDVVAAKAAHHAIPLFAKVLACGTTAERAHALRLLADPRTMSKDLAGARRAIASAIGDGEVRIAADAAKALAHLSNEEEFFEAIGADIETTKLEHVNALISAMRKYTSARTFEFLTRKFRAGPNVIRMAVLETLESMKTDDALPLLLEALSSSRLDVRVRAAESLATLASTGSVDIARAVIWLLRSRDANVRRIAVEIVHKTGDATGELTAKLLRFLRDEDWWVRERVLDTLVELAGASLTRHLAAFLQDPSDVVRRFAVGGLHRVHDPRSLGALVRTALEDSDWWVREKAILAVAELGEKKAAPYILEVMQRHPLERLVCLEALAKLGNADVAPKVAELVGDDEPEVRLAAISCLATLNARGCVDVVRSRSDDPDFNVRRAATELLARWQIVIESARGTGAGDESLNILDRLLIEMARMGADDLILIPERKPSVKHQSKIKSLRYPELSAEQMRAILFAHLAPAQVANLARRTDVDFSHEVKAHGLRFRGHIFAERRGFGAVFRIVRGEIPEISALGLPPIIKSFATLKNGLVLVGGPTGSGKSTTLAALVDYINRTSARHIVTVEDPIEVVHAHRKSLISQREVGTHTNSFSAALRSTLRQDPDVILVGEMRDLTTIGFAVSAAETGHLVFGTVHTVSADTTVDRLVNAFPPGQQPQVRSMLSDSLQAVICQHLLRRANSEGRVSAVEVMINNSAVANMIRKGKTFQIPNVVQTSRDVGMQSMDAELVRLVKEGTVSHEDAYMKANDKKVFDAAFAPPAVVAPGKGPARNAPAASEP